MALKNTSMCSVVSCEFIRASKLLLASRPTTWEGTFTFTVTVQFLQ